MILEDIFKKSDLAAYYSEKELPAVPAYKSSVQEDVEKKEKKEKNEIRKEESPLSFERVIDEMNRLYQKMDRKVKFSMHQGTGRIVARVINKDDGRILREVPPEDFLNFIARMQEYTGLVFDKVA